MSNGIPIGAPCHRPEPKSAWTGRSRPIDATIVAESAATGRLSTRWFHGFEAVKTGQPARRGGGGGGGGGPRAGGGGGRTPPAPPPGGGPAARRRRGARARR